MNPATPTVGKTGAKIPSITQGGSAPVLEGQQRRNQQALVRLCHSRMLGRGQWDWDKECLWS